MKYTLLYSGLVALAVHTGVLVVAIKCYSCTYTRTETDVLGDPDCADDTWNIAPDDPTRVKTTCLGCTKALYWITAERFEVTRGCLENFNSTTGFDRTQKSNTCGVMQLDTGNFTNCNCDTDLCNMRQNCDASYGCWESCATTCPPLSC